MVAAATRWATGQISLDVLYSYMRERAHISIDVDVEFALSRERENSYRNAQAESSIVDDGRRKFTAKCMVIELSRPTTTIDYIGALSSRSRVIDNSA